MATKELLRNAPISEAILDVRVSTRRDLRSDELAVLTSELRDRFPTKEERRDYRFNATIVNGISTQQETVDLGVAGYFFKSADGLDVAQFRVDGFTLNRLRPYQSWEEWFPLFARTWAYYLKVAKPVRVTRIATRCINHLPAPADGVLTQYLTNPPTIPAGIPSQISAFVTTVALNSPGDPSLGLNLTQALEGTAEGAQRLVLDIDAYRLGDFDPSDILDRFEELRRVRDDAFFESITSDAKERFR